MCLQHSRWAEGSKAIETTPYPALHDIVIQSFDSQFRHNEGSSVFCLTTFKGTDIYFGDKAEQMRDCQWLLKSKASLRNISFFMCLLQFPGGASPCFFAVICVSDVAGRLPW